MFWYDLWMVGSSERPSLPNFGMIERNLGEYSKKDWFTLISNTKQVMIII